MDDDKSLVKRGERRWSDGESRGEERNKKSWRNRRGISVAICSPGLIYKFVKAAVGRGWWYAYTPSGVSSFATGKGSRAGGETGGGEGKDGARRTRRGMKKEEAEEARVTEEFRNDRRPVASLTDDALLRSRLQAQKDGTAVMDSKWLEIVDRCHRASPLSLLYFLLYSSPPLLLISLSRLFLSPLIPRTKPPRGTRCTASKARVGDAHGTWRDSCLLFAHLNFRSRERGRDVSKLRSLRARNQRNRG
jgi:hypothetical protein